MKPEYHYQLVSLQTLSGFQTLEFSLKIYIASTYKQIQDKLSGDIPFRYSYKDIKNQALGTLLYTFKKLNDNTDLQKRLDKLVQKRNHVAHIGLLIPHKEIRYLLDEDLEENHANIKSVSIELDDCLQLMALELEKTLPKEPEGKAQQGVHTKK